MDTHIERLIEQRDTRAALTALVEAHGAALGRFLCAALGSREDGEEALQDTLVAVLAALPSYRRQSPLRAWVFGIARHVAADHMRKRARRRGLWARFFQRDEETRPHEDSDARLTLEHALGRLSPGLREAVLLRYQLGMDATEVADVLAISHAAARKRLSQAVQTLRVELAEAGLTTLTLTPTLPINALEVRDDHPV